MFSRQRARVVYGGLLRALPHGLLPGLLARDAYYVVLRHWRARCPAKQPLKDKDGKLCSETLSRSPLYQPNLRARLNIALCILLEIPNEVISIFPKRLTRAPSGRCFWRDQQVFGTKFWKLNPLASHSAKVAMDANKKKTNIRYKYF